MKTAATSIVSFLVGAAVFFHIGLLVEKPASYDVRIGQVTVDEYYTDAGVDE
jgi:hypothetical protein